MIYPTAVYYPVYNTVCYVCVYIYTYIGKCTHLKYNIHSLLKLKNETHLTINEQND